MKNRHSPRQQNWRGRPRLPFKKTVPGRIHAKLGSLNSIRWRLKFGGETAHDLLQSVGLDPERFSNERVSKIVEVMFKHAGKRSPLSRSHKLQWNIARVLRHIAGFQDRREIDTLVLQMTSQRWITRETKRAGSFEKLLAECSISRMAEERLRTLLRGNGIHIPKEEKTVKLRCRKCHRTFTRLKSYERRFEGKRKGGPLCGIKHL